MFVFLGLLWEIIYQLLKGISGNLDHFDFVFRYMI